ncbi:MAG: FHA domain-containing protein [Oscillospiraceae bacterium]|nr:FHA domain-containing protein [Oscillospiraceae bacterium]
MKNRILTRAAAMLCAALLLLAALPMSAWAIPEDIIVRVSARDAAGDVIQNGIGFRITDTNGNQRFLAEDLSSYPYASLLITSAFGDDVWGDCTVMDVVGKVMTVTSDSNHSVSLPRFASAQLSAGQTVETVGYDMANNGTFGAVVSGRIDKVDASYVDFTLDAPCYCIGAPLCLPDGSVVGVVADMNDDYMVCRARLLTGDSNSNGGGSDDGGGGSGGGSNTPEFWEDIGAKIGGGLLLIAVCVGYLVFRGKQKKKAAQVTYNALQPQPQNQQYQQPNIGVTQPGVQPAPPQPASNAPALTGIRGTGGQYNTMTFPVGDRILFGRDPARCNIIFEAQTNGVSSLHCELVRVGAGLQLADRASSYGTFLNGTKLSPNVPVTLKPGDVFYLGDKRNSFAAY